MGANFGQIARVKEIHISKLPDDTPNSKSLIKRFRLEYFRKGKWLVHGIFETGMQAKDRSEQIIRKIQIVDKSSDGLITKRVRIIIEHEDFVKWSNVNA